MASRARLVLAGAALALLSLAAAGCRAPPARSPMGRPLPAVDLRTADDAPARLDVLVRGRPALVSFWGTWCARCVDELAALDRLARAVAPQGGIVVGVAVGEPRSGVARFLEGRGLAYPQLVDEDLSMADAMDQRRLPATVVVDRAGKVVYAGGALDEQSLAAFRAVLARP